MNTKIVYVVASLDADIYMEQAIVSAWSARHYNPDCRIEMVCDQDTFATLESGIRAQYRLLFDEVHVQEFQPEQSMMERSRWMKTTLREIVKGDFLYLDTDTVVCADLSYVDDFQLDLGMVRDCNCEFSQSLVYDWVVPTMKTLYDIDVSNETMYYNGGVAFVRDCQLTRDFYHHWNELWVYSLRHFNKLKDQQPLMKANIDMGYVITELPGDMNCLVVESIKYLHTAHVVHFVNNLKGKCDALSPLYKELYLQVKQSGLTDEVKDIILKCKSSFISPSMMVPREGAMLWRKHLATDGLDEKIRSSNAYHAICAIWLRYPKLMRFIEWTLDVMIRMFHAIRLRKYPLRGRQSMGKSVKKG